MRRFLLGAGCYLAGIMTLPMLSVGLNTLDARIASRDQPYRGIKIEKAARPADPVVVIASPGRDATCQVMLPAAGQCGVGHARALELSSSLAQVDVKDAEGESFGQPAPAQVPRRTALTRDEERALLDAQGETPIPEVEPTVPANIVVPDLPVIRGLRDMLPIGPVILAGDAPQDEAEAAKTTELREQLLKVIEEKKALLNSHGLELEIKLHQRHLAELKSLKELLALQASLQELKDKYPDSIAGRRAQELLDLLIQQHHRNERPTPIPDFGTHPNESSAPHSKPLTDDFDQPPDFKDAPIKTKGK